MKCFSFQVAVFANAAKSVSLALENCSNDQYSGVNPK